jgi:hypothetical protein
MSITTVPGGPPEDRPPIERAWRRIWLGIKTLMLAVTAPLLVIYLIDAWGKFGAIFVGSAPFAWTQFTVWCAIAVALTLTTLKLLHYLVISLDAIARICNFMSMLLRWLEAFFRGEKR